MSTRLIIGEDSVYGIDEDCLQKKQRVASPDERRGRTESTEGSSGYGSANRQAGTSSREVEKRK